MERDDSSRDRWRPATAADNGPVAGLERVRQHFHRWIETIAGRLEEAAAAPGGTDGRGLAEGWEALRAETERRDREWAERLDALEHDRRLLAEAWERLERELVASGATPPASTAAPAGSTAIYHADARGRGTENPLDGVIIQQFELLRRDVRSTFEARLRAGK